MDQKSTSPQRFLEVLGRCCACPPAQLGLDVPPVSDGGRVVQVFKTGETFMTGQLDRDMTELPGVREALKIRSKLGVPLDIGGERRGMMMIASLKPDFFSAGDARFAEQTLLESLSAL